MPMLLHLLDPRLGVLVGVLDLAHGRLDVAVDERPHRIDQHGLFCIQHMYGHIDTMSSLMPAWAAVTLYGQIPGGPYFDDLQVGQVFDTAPSMTLTTGAAAVHQSILGDRLRLALDAQLAYAVTGRDRGAGAPGAGVRRRDRPEHAGHPAGQGQPVLPRAAVSPVPGDRRFAVHPHRGGGPEAELGQTRQGGHRPRGAADDHRRSASAGWCWTSTGARWCRCATAPPIPAMPTTCRRSAPTPLQRRTRPRAGTPPHFGRGCQEPGSMPASQARCCTAPPTWSAARPSWPD